MARIAGINLPQDKRVEIALTYIFGIGRSMSNAILEETKIDPNTKVKDLNDGQINQLRDFIGKNQVEGDLRRNVSQNVKRLKEISTYRGVRHTKRLPVRGQRTKTNARTKRGRRVTMGSGKLKVTKT